MPSGLVNMGEALELAQSVDSLLGDKLKLISEVKNITRQLKKTSSHDESWRGKAEYALSKRKEKLSRINSVLAVKVKEETGVAFMEAAREALDPAVFQQLMDAAKSKQT